MISGTYTTQPENGYRNLTNGSMYFPLFEPNEKKRPERKRISTNRSVSNNTKAALKKRIGDKLTQRVVVGYRSTNITDRERNVHGYLGELGAQAYNDDRQITTSVGKLRKADPTQNKYKCMSCPGRS
jgi:hypothetical protein